MTVKNNSLGRFINKYHLESAVASSKWKVKNDTLSARFMTEDRTLLGKVTLNNFDLDDCEVGVYNTSQLQKMTSVLSNTININLKKAEERAIAIHMDDSDVSLNYMLADLDIIPKAPKLLNLLKQKTL